MADGFGVSGFILKGVHISASMQKRFLHIAIRKYDFVEKRAGKAREPKSEKRASGNQKSARAEIRKARKRKPEKRASLKKKNLDFSTFAG